MKIAIAGTGYVGLSNAMLLSLHNEVVALDIVPEKIALLHQKKLYGHHPVCQDLCRCAGTDRLQFYIRPVVQVGTCWP